jgi:hypothetical protein
MIPWEREIYLHMLIDHLEEMKQKQEQQRV